jgi:hypothetical protein
MNIVDGINGDLLILRGEVVFKPDQNLDQVGKRSVDGGSYDFDLAELFEDFFQWSFVCPGSILMDGMDLKFF